jgi:NAD(P)-dependent dehydrogenase (short-subunit alcohol dehydrogenase family)
MERIPSEVQEKYLARIPLNHFGFPQDVANCVAFLASDDANYITGEVLNVSGGFLGWL